MGASPSQSGTAHQFVQKPTELPEPVAIIPTRFPANAPNVFQNGLLILDGNRLLVLQDPIFGYLDIFFEVFLNLSAGNAILPTANDKVLLYFFEGHINGFFVTVGFQAQHLLQTIILGNDFHLHAIHKVDG